MKTRIVHCRFWQDQFISSLDKNTKLLFIYLLTNDRVSLTGIYELPDKYIKIDLDLTEEELQESKKNIQNYKKILFHDGWIMIINHDKYNSYKGGKIDKAKEKEIANIPQSIYQYMKEKIRTIDTSINTSIATSSDTLNNHKSKNIIHKSKNKNQKTKIKKQNKEKIEKNNINEIISLFEPLNPSYKRLFANKTERAALQRLIDNHGEFWVSDLVSRLPEIVSEPYAPRITTPYELEKKLGQLKIFLSQEKGKINKFGVTQL